MHQCVACLTWLSEDDIRRTDFDTLRFCPHGDTAVLVCPACLRLTPSHFGLTEFHCPGCDAVMDSSTVVRRSPPTDPDGAAAYVCDFCLNPRPEQDVFHCPDRSCRGMVICTDCFRCYDEPDLQCPHCTRFLQDTHGVAARHVRRADRRLLGQETPPSEGCTQVQMQCYAAATATACNWATGTRLTSDDAMHLFMMSPVKGTSEPALAYRSAFAAARARVGEDASEAEVLADMRSTPRGEAAYRAALGAPGEPEFPGDVPHLYLTGLTDDHLRLAMVNKCTVMLAAENHWIVIYGCEVDAADDVRIVHTYDPLGGERLQQQWEALRSVGREAYVVGMSSPAPGPTP
ncbi:hypothetical protein [Streptomyces sp. WAC06614]|uniref:hypothetical protein n=1 Tax=Streptomyces sp. WAC06614 TaxID=2487416 RepID=UPI000F7B2275|nr:hypothetical protein [Streptomyces sp. WAC06614]RSS81849.1 hypothetical protein EF918_08955 [Streptomyces sp. WAC06614]